VTIAFKITERADQLHHDNAPAHSTALMQAFLAKQHITQAYQPPYSPDLAPCDFWLFPKLKSTLKVRRFVNAMVTEFTSSVNGVSLPTD
jgi:transposase